MNTKNNSYKLRSTSIRQCHDIAVSFFYLVVQKCFFLILASVTRKIILVLLQIMKLRYLQLCVIKFYGNYMLSPIQS